METLNTYIKYKLIIEKIYKKNLVFEYRKFYMYVRNSFDLKNYHQVLPSHYLNIIKHWGLYLTL